MAQSHELPTGPMDKLELTQFLVCEVKPSTSELLSLTHGLANFKQIQCKLQR